MRNTILAMAVLAAFTFSSAQAEESSQPKLANGLLMKQGGKLVFAPCRDRSYALLEDVSADGALTAALNRIGLEAGKKLYVELFAVVEGAAVKANSLNLARADGRCQPPAGKDEAWRAAGEGWTLAAGGEKVLLQRSGKQDVTVPYRPFKAEGAAISYEASQGDLKLALHFAPALCQDEAGGALLGWKAVVKANGVTLEGCAWQR